MKKTKNVLLLLLTLLVASISISTVSGFSTELEQESRALKKGKSNSKSKNKTDKPGKKKNDKKGKKEKKGKFPKKPKKTKSPKPPKKMKSPKKTKKTKSPKKTKNKTSSPSAMPSVNKTSPPSATPSVMTPTPSGICGPSEDFFTVEIQSIVDADEIAWSVSNLNDNNIILDSRPFDHYPNVTDAIIEETVCVPSGLCYNFTIFDQDCDGFLPPSAIVGNYKVFYQDVLVGQGGGSFSGLLTAPCGESTIFGDACP